MLIHERIRKLRRDRNWTQDELGERAGTIGRNIVRYESGRTMPRKAMIERLAQAFELTVDELLSDANPAPLEIEDPELLRLFREVATMPEADRTAVKRVLDLVVKQNRIQQVMAS